MMIILCFFIASVIASVIVWAFVRVGARYEKRAGDQSTHPGAHHQ